MQIVSTWDIWRSVICKITKGIQSSCNGSMGWFIQFLQHAVSSPLSQNHAFSLKYVVLTFYVLSGDQWSICDPAIGWPSCKKQGQMGVISWYFIFIFETIECLWECQLCIISPFFMHLYYILLLFMKYES